MGVIATEGRLREKNCPADPADISSHERIVQQVGGGSCVRAFVRVCLLYAGGNPWEEGGYVGVCGNGVRGGGGVGGFARVSLAER